MEIDRVEASSPAVAKVLGFVFRFFVRFVELPFLFAVFFLIFFIITNIFGSTLLQEKLMSLFLWPLSAVFHYPDTFNTESFTPVLQVVAFWLLAFHILWETSAAIFRKSEIFTTKAREKTTRNGLWLALIIAVISVLFSDNIAPPTWANRFYLAGFLILVTLTGQFSYRVGRFLAQFSEAFMSYRGPQK